MKRFMIVLLLFAIAIPSFAEIRSKRQNQHFVFYDDVTYETLDVMAPFKMFEEFDWPAVANFTVLSPSSSLIFADLPVNSASNQITAATGGILVTQLGIADNDDIDISSEIVFWPIKYPVVEARLRIGCVTTAFNIGFSDATGEAADKIAFTYSGTTLTSTASNGAVFMRDYDATTDYIYCASTNADSDGTTTSSGTTFAVDTWHIYRVEIDASGNAYFFLDGALVYTESLAVRINSPLCVYFGYIMRSGINVDFPTAEIDYIKAWQRR